MSSALDKTQLFLPERRRWEHLGNSQWSRALAFFIADEHQMGTAQELERNRVLPFITVRDIRWEHVGNYEMNRVLAFITAKEHQVRTSRELYTENQIKKSDDFSFFSLLAIENLKIHLIWQETRIFFKSRFVLATFAISKCGQFSSKYGKFC